MKKISNETRKKISDAHIGKHHSDETRKKMSVAHKGKHHSEETREKIRWTHIERAKHLSNEERMKMSEPNRGEKNHNWGKHPSEESRRKMSEAHRGENHYNWKGGITTINHKQRTSSEYKIWRIAVFERDNYTCVWCGIKFIKGVTGNVVLNADHIKSFALFPELRLVLDNGRTLCVPCHKKTDTYGGRKLNPVF